MLPEQSRSLASGLGLFSFIKKWGGGGRKGIMDFAMFYWADGCRGNTLASFLTLCHAQLLLSGKDGEWSDEG